MGQGQSEVWRSGTMGGCGRYILYKGMKFSNIKNRHLKEKSPGPLPSMYIEPRK